MVWTSSMEPSGLSWVGVIPRSIPKLPEEGYEGYAEENADPSPAKPHGRGGSGKRLLDELPQPWIFGMSKLQRRPVKDHSPLIEHQETGAWIDSVIRDGFHTVLV